MIKMVTLNLDDIKELIVEKYNADKEKINVIVYPSSDDGPYHNGPLVFMEFEEKNDGKNN